MTLTLNQHGRMFRSAHHLVIVNHTVSKSVKAYARYGADTFRYHILSKSVEAYARYGADTKRDRQADNQHKINMSQPYMGRHN